MASIRRVERKSGPAWQVLWRDRATRKQSAKTLRTQREAKAYAAKIERMQDGGQRPSNEIGRRTVESVALDVPQPKTPKAQEVRKYALQRLGDLRGYELRHVTQAAIEKALEGKEGSTRNQSVFLLRMTWREAAEQGYVGPDPTKALKTTRPKPPRRFLSTADVDRLARELGEHGDLVQVIAYTGLRVGELTGLQAGDWDAGQRTLRVQRAVSWVNGIAHVGDPKTAAGRRIVPVPDSIAPILEAAAKGKKADQWLWTSPRGYMWSSNNWRRNARWKEVTERLGWPGLRLHDLRHSYASIARAAGVDLYVLSRIMGHSSIAITSDLYGGAYDE